MCQYKYTQHSCGHILPKFEENYDPSCKLCVPVLVALKYYHDQPTHECIENARQQAPLRIPKPCRPVGPHIMGDAEKLTNILAQDQARFERIMDEVGVNSAERSFIAQLALRHNQTSKRIIKMPLLPVSQRKLDFVRELEVWQQRQYQPPNITYNSVSWGCGGTGPGVQGHCLVGWTGLGILMYRHGIWNVNPPHPSHAWSPLPVRYLYINYGEAPVLQLPADWQNEVTRTLIDIPMYECLYTVLYGRPSGPMIQNDEGYLVPALGASGPGIPVIPHFPLPSPISLGQPLPRLPISSGHKGQPRPRQAFVPAARLRQGSRHQYSATWNSSAPINQTLGGSKPHQAQKQRTNRAYKERHDHSQAEAGPSQSEDRAEINTKIKELPQRRATRSGNTTPATTTTAGVSQPVYPTHPTVGSTRPATSTGNQSEEPTVGLGIIDESPPAASVEDTVGNAEDTVLYRPPRHRIPQSHEAQAHEAGPSTSTSEGKKPIRPVLSRQNSNVKFPSPADEIPLNMSSNMLIGASQPPTRPTTPPQTSHPTPSPLISQNITQSTTNVTQFTAELNANAQQQQVPGVTYTLNPTAEAFEPASGGAEEGEGKDGE